MVNPMLALKSNATNRREAAKDKALEHAWDYLRSLRYDRSPNMELLTKARECFAEHEAYVEMEADAELRAPFTTAKE